VSQPCALPEPPPLPVGGAAVRHRVRRVEEIRLAVARGTYHVPADRVADALLAHIAHIRSGRGDGPAR
jgi:hypothetical protein